MTTKPNQIRARNFVLSFCLVLSLITLLACSQNKESDKASDLRNTAHKARARTAPAAPPPMPESQNIAKKISSREMDDYAESAPEPTSSEVSKKAPMLQPIAKKRDVRLSRLYEQEKLAQKINDPEKGSEVRHVPGATGKSKDKGKGVDITKIEKSRRLSTSEQYRGRAPELLARIEGPHQSPLPLVANDIAVVIAGHRARVVCDMIFHNPSSRQLSGTLMVQMPDGASPCYLGMFQGQGWSVPSPKKLPAQLLNPQAPQAETLLAHKISLARTWRNGELTADWGELRSARVVNPVQGRKVYEKVTRQRIDPALAEWAGSGKFSTRIFPIPGNGYKRVVFAYDRPLLTNQGQLLYPLPVPKKIKGQTRLTTHLVGEQLHSAELLANKETIAATKTDYGQRWQMPLAADLAGSIVFHARPATPSLQVLAGKDPKVPGQLVHLRYQPQVEIHGQKQKSGRALFIIDTSYSGKDKLSALSGKMLRAILEHDRSISEFAAISFDVRARWITNGFVANDSRQQQQLLTAVEKIWLEGATNFAAVMEFLQQQQLAATDTIFLLSDGHITWGVENPLQFARKFPDWINKRWICYAFGDVAVNRSLLQTLSRQRGQIVHVGLGQDLSAAAQAHLNPVTTLEKVRGSKGEELLVSGNPALLYPGQALEIAAMISPRAKDFTMVLKINGREHQVKVAVKVNPLTSGLAARSWADLYSQRLLELYDEEANQVALALSQHFALTNRQASFIILETDQEYKLYQIDSARLDFEKLSNLAAARTSGRPFGAPRLDDLSKSSRALITALAPCDRLAIWQVKPPAPITDSLASISQAPRQNRQGNTPSGLYLWAKSLYEQNSELSAAQALRVLSTIVELKPQDDQALRLVGYVLLQWQMYQEAQQLFTRVRQRRPFEPQNYLMEGMALAALGQVNEAAVRYEIVLQRSFERFDSYVKPVAAVLYADLLKGVIQQTSDKSLSKKCRQRLQELEATRTPQGRLVLFWNLDNTDVDLHVQEAKDVEVYYSNKKSPSGGELFWDNTDGLGPELYEHPQLSREGFAPFVKYFGSSAVEGAAPAATLVAVFTANKERSRYQTRWFATVLINVQGDKVAIMPNWKAQF